jgi:hypothetical protein
MHNNDALTMQPWEILLLPTSSYMCQVANTARLVATVPPALSPTRLLMPAYLPAVTPTGLLRTGCRSPQS